MQALLFALVVLLSGSGLVWLSASAGAFAAPKCRQPVWPLVVTKGLTWLWLLGLLYAGLCRS